MALNEIHLFLQLWVLHIQIQTSKTHWRHPAQVKTLAPIIFYVQTHLAAARFTWLPAFIVALYATVLFRARLAKFCLHYHHWREKQIGNRIPSWHTLTQMIWYVLGFRVLLRIKRLETSLWNKGVFPSVSGCALVCLIIMHCEHKTTQGTHSDRFRTNDLFWNKAKQPTCENTFKIQQRQLFPKIHDVLSYCLWFHKGADEAALHDRPVRADAEDFQRVCPAPGLPRWVPVHEGPVAAQHRSVFRNLRCWITTHYPTWSQF